jgi:hypothetical protein
MSLHKAIQPREAVVCLRFPNRSRTNMVAGFNHPLQLSHVGLLFASSTIQISSSVVLSIIDTVLLSLLCTSPRDSQPHLSIEYVSSSQAYLIQGPLRPTRSHIYLILYSTSANHFCFDLVTFHNGWVRVCNSRFDRSLINGRSLATFIDEVVQPLWYWMSKYARN